MRKQCATSNRWKLIGSENKHRFQMVSAFFCTLLINSTVLAASLGMVADNANDVVKLFDVESGAIVASINGETGRISGDCALSRDQVTGFSSHANQRIAVYQLSEYSTDEGVGVSSIEISNAGVDMSLSPDGRLLVSVGAGNSYEPLSVVDTQSKLEVATAGLFLDHTSAEFCDDGTLLVTTTYGNSFAMPFDNAIYDASVSPDGAMELLGNRLSSGAQPNNASCAPGSKAGVLLDRESGLTSFTLPGLEKADSASLQGAIAVSAVFNHGGERLYVRTSEAVHAFNFNPINGLIEPDWVQTVSFSSEYFGIDQIALDPDRGRLYVDGGEVLLVLDPATGLQSGSIHTGDATGICFAQRQPLDRVPEMVKIELHHNDSSGT